MQPTVQESLVARLSSRVEHDEAVKRPSNGQPHGGSVEQLVNQTPLQMDWDSVRPLKTSLKKVRVCHTSGGGHKIHWGMGWGWGNELLVNAGHDF